MPIGPTTTRGRARSRAGRTAGASGVAAVPISRPFPRRSRARRPAGSTTYGWPKRNATRSAPAPCRGRAGPASPAGSRRGRTTCPTTTSRFPAAPARASRRRATGWTPSRASGRGNDPAPRARRLLRVGSVPRPFHPAVVRRAGPFRPLRCRRVRCRPPRCPLDRPRPARCRRAVLRAGGVSAARCRRAPRLPPRACRGRCHRELLPARPDRAVRCPRERLPVRWDRAPRPEPRAGRRRAPYRDRPGPQRVCRGRCRRGPGRACPLRCHRELPPARPARCRDRHRRAPAGPDLRRAAARR